MKYEVIGEPQIEAEYSDEYETVMVIDLQRGDGETGDVWIVAGVPDYQRGTANAMGLAGDADNLQTVRVYGDSPDTWCPESFRVRDLDGTYSTVAGDVIAACEAVALAAHRERMRCNA